MRPKPSGQGKNEKLQEGRSKGEPVGASPLEGAIHSTIAVVCFSLTPAFAAFTVNLLSR
jgi:hypothetical protein